MIETIEIHPFLVRMTGLAGVAKRTVMHVRLLVAGIAIDRRWLIALVGMAVFAFCVEMFAAEWERALVMVERGSIFPVFLRMAGLTGVTQGPFMLVIFLMTGLAGGRGFLLRHGDFVTAFARGRLVLAP